MFTTAKIAFIFTSLSVLQISALTLVIIAYWCLACIKNLQVVAFLVMLMARNTERYIGLYWFSFCWYFVNYKTNVLGAKTVSPRTRLSAKSLKEASEWRGTMSFSRVTFRSRVLVLITRAQLTESMLPRLCVKSYLKLRSFIEGQGKMLLLKC